MSAISSTRFGAPLFATWIIARPRQLYKGEGLRSYIPLEHRS